MGILKEFERSLEGSVEGFFGRVFRSRLQPLELAKALERYADDHKLVAADSTVVQNVYEFTVGAKDHDRLDGLGDKLVHGLAEVVRRNAEQRGHRLAGPVVVRLRRDDAVRVGMFELAGRVDPRVVDPRVAATPRGDHPKTPAPALPASEQLFGKGARRRDRTGPNAPAAAYGANGVPPVADDAFRPPVAEPDAGWAVLPQVEDPDAAAVAEDLDTPPSWARQPAPGLADEPPPFSLDPPGFETPGFDTPGFDTPGAEAPLFSPAPPPAPAPAPTSGTDHVVDPEETAAPAEPAPEPERPVAGPGAGLEASDDRGVDGRAADGGAADERPVGGGAETPTTSDSGGRTEAMPSLLGPRAQLRVRTSGASRIGSIDLVGGRLLVGRHRDCDLRLDDTTVSREHAAFVRRGATWWVLDMGSTNGTSVNGVGAAEQVLTDGDTVAVGDVELVFSEG